MQIRHAMRLKEIARSGSAARGTLERAGLDYCCEGHRSLADACTAAGVSVETVESLLRDIPEDPPTAGSTGELPVLLDRVLSELHPRTKRLLQEAREAAAELARIDARGRSLVEALDALVEHASAQMREEEDVLYVRVRALAEARLGRGPYPSPPFRTIHEHGDRIRAGHRKTHDCLREVRSRLAELVGPGAEDVHARVNRALASLLEQMHVENNELLPRARDLEPNDRSVHAG